MAKAVLKAKDQVWYATGRRKESNARVYMKKGTGKIIVNHREFDHYFVRPTSRMVIQQPLDLTSNLESFDFYINVNGGGMSGQAGATRLGVARALITFDPALRGVLKKAGYLTRDSRTVERKKPGLAGARRRFQFSKR